MQLYSRLAHINHAMGMPLYSSIVETLDLASEEVTDHLASSEVDGAVERAEIKSRRERVGEAEWKHERDPTCVVSFCYGSRRRENTHPGHTPEPSSQRAWSTA